MNKNTQKKKQKTKLILHCLLINRNDTLFYRTKSKKYVSGYEFLSFTRNLFNKYGKQSLGTATKTGLDALKTASKKVVCKAAEATGNKITDRIVKPKPVPDENVRNVARKERRNIERIKRSIVKMEHHKISKVLNVSTVSKSVTRKWIEVNDLSGGQYSVNKDLRFKMSMLRSDVCDYSDVYIVVKEKITAGGTDDASKRNKKLVFKNDKLFFMNIKNQQRIDRQCRRFSFCYVNV